MKTRPLILLASTLLVGVLLFLTNKNAQPKIEKIDKVDPVSDRPLASYQNELLDLAFKTASAMPLMPHIKNRSRAQEEVIAACFEVDQPRRALRYIEQIDNWRRGAGYADFAFYCAQQGDTREVKHYLDLARQIAERPQEEEDQDWQRDRIRAKVAKTYALLGQTHLAEELEANLAHSESGAVAVVKAMQVSAADFDRQIQTLEGVAATGSFEEVRNALETYAQFFNRFYQDKERRALAEEKIKNSWKKLPKTVCIELLMKLAGFALGYKDYVKALELVNEAQQMIEGSPWAAEHHVALIARVAGLRYRAGDRAKARSDADAALAMFDVHRDQIINIYRAGALRPLAEAYHSMGESAVARMVYKKALEEGVENINSRPRAQDLSATCCSMALHGVEPDADLWATIQQIHAGLGDPW